MADACVIVCKFVTNIFYTVAPADYKVAIARRYPSVTVEILNRRISTHCQEVFLM